MPHIGAISYAVGAIAFLVLTLVLLTGWRGRLQGGLLVLAALASTVWAADLAVESELGLNPSAAMLVLETVRSFAWLAFLLRVLRYAPEAVGRGNLRIGGVAVFGLTAMLLVIPAAYPYLVHWVSGAFLGRLSLFGYLGMAITGLWLVEILFRTSRPEARWAIKFLCLGIGGLFAYDFFLYSNALLFKHVDAELWEARGAVNALVVPLIAVSAARNPQWSLNVFVSRGVVYHTATLVSAGTYLLVMAATGYYIKMFGGHWGAVVQVIFLFGALIMLSVLMFSGQLRANLKVLLSKHFFNYRYDYREEWLRFTNTLSRCREHAEPRECVVEAIARVVESPGGMLWGRDGDRLVPVARWNITEPAEAAVTVSSPFARFLRERNWVIDLDELARDPQRYPGLEAPSWLDGLAKAWLVVPLLDEGELMGFVVLTRSRARLSFDWEVRDLLKTVACQAASYLGQLEAVKALSEARQFEGFNRLSAFVLHDLKNVIAQQSLIINSAARHKHNPAFIDDAVRVMEHSVSKMHRLMTLLRGDASSAQPMRLDLVQVLEGLVRERSAQEPKPRMESAVSGPLWVNADRDRVSAAIGNLIQNAQEATPKDGQVTVTLEYQDGRARCAVADNGCGMDAAFVRERLFRPFDTTKGDTGMGIGAYESREYLRSLGGEIDVTSEPGSGTTFRVALPAEAGVSETGAEQREATG
ncbi:MAG TPA: XrtA/PEP-CTERM system histidine kinase PrsK [Gammaproteobacteria bacterium]|nr:XrtA/PEP-CTERM system histidine kinase PrsK [Gammaproteobacteria bacterium]